MHCFLTSSLYDTWNRCVINYRANIPLLYLYTHTTLFMWICAAAACCIHMWHRLLQFFMVNFLANISKTLSLPFSSCVCAIFMVVFFSPSLYFFIFLIILNVHSRSLILAHILFTFRFRFNNLYNFYVWLSSWRKDFAVCLTSQFGLYFWPYFCLEKLWSEYWHLNFFWPLKFLFSCSFYQFFLIGTFLDCYFLSFFFYQKIFERFFLKKFWPLFLAHFPWKSKLLFNFFILLFSIFITERSTTKSAVRHHRS